MHVFPYSIRPGTPAAKMENQIDKKVKKERAAKASAIANEMSESFANAQIGMALRVLFETETDGVSRGHSENYLEVEVLETGLHGKVLNVQVTDTKNCILRGQLIK